MKKIALLGFFLSASLTTVFSQIKKKEKLTAATQPIHIQCAVIMDTTDYKNLRMYIGSLPVQDPSNIYLWRIIQNAQLINTAPPIKDSSIKK